MCSNVFVDLDHNAKNSQIRMLNARWHALCQHKKKSLLTVRILKAQARYSYTFYLTFPPKAITERDVLYSVYL